MKKKLNIQIESQPDDTTCGPTCLASVYRYWGDPVDLQVLREEIKQFDNGGGTLAVILACHALKRGYHARLYSYNLNIFDPCWSMLENDGIVAKLKEQLLHKGSDEKFSIASKAYIKFLELGGDLRFDELTSDLIEELIEDDYPILTGLSATYLYKSQREDPITNEFDDVKGYPSGHFVVLYGVDDDKEQVFVADPYILNPVANQNYYSVHLNRLISSILLGVVTYDGNLLLIYPEKK